MSIRRLILAATLPLLLAAPAQAALQSYLLTQSNADAQLPDGTSYLWLTIEDVSPTRIDFRLSILSPLTSIAGPNFGLQEFAFNVAGTAQPLVDSATLPSAWLLPSGWSAGVAPPSNRADGFGAFEVSVGTTGSGRLPVLEFSLLNSGLSATSFAETSSDNAGQGSFYFAAHVTGFDTGGTTSAYFAGSTAGAPSPSPVPLPAAGLLLPVGAALGLGALRRGRKGRAGTPA